MNRTRRIVIIALTALAVLAAMPSVAAAGSRPRVVRLPHSVLAGPYKQAVNTTLNNNVLRIQRRVNRIRFMNPRLKFRLKNDVNVGAMLIRQRVDAYSRDGRITAWEQAQIRQLSNSISANLRRSYKNLDSFILL